MKGEGRGQERETQDAQLLCVTLTEPRMGPLSPMFWVVVLSSFSLQVVPSWCYRVTRGDLTGRLELKRELLMIFGKGVKRALATLDMRRCSVLGSRFSNVVVALTHAWRGRYPRREGKGDRRELGLGAGRGDYLRRTTTTTSTSEQSR